MPLEAYISPVKTLKVEDLPAPLTPSKLKHSPFDTPKLSPDTAKTGSQISYAQNFF